MSDNDDRPAGMGQVVPSVGGGSDLSDVTGGASVGSGSGEPEGIGSVVVGGGSGEPEGMGTVSP